MQLSLFEYHGLDDNGTGIRITSFQQILDKYSKFVTDGKQEDKNLDTFMVKLEKELK